MEITVAFEADWKERWTRLRGPDCVLEIWTFRGEVWVDVFDGFFWELLRLGDRIAYGKADSAGEAKEAIEAKIREVVEARNRLDGPKGP